MGRDTACGDCGCETDEPHRQEYPDGAVAVCLCQCHDDWLRGRAQEALKRHVEVSGRTTRPTE